MEPKILTSIAQVEADAWDSLTGDRNPLLDHGHLALLEASGSVGAGTSWLPRPIIMQDESGLLAAMPCYVKNDSYGEYIFDWSWAQAAEAGGLRYYPKLVAAVPFTPATGPRILTRSGAGPQQQDALVQALGAFAHQHALSGIHVLFCLEEEASALQRMGFTLRKTHQFHWFNEGYRDFADFLDTLRAGPRKQIKKERRRVHETGLDIEQVRGCDADDHTWNAMNDLYRSTYARKWGDPYLSPQFFEMARDYVGESTVFVTARRGSTIVAATLSFEKGPHLYGRYWGATEHVENLHFELCYYQLIERAISTRKLLFEAGAQGPHKLKRGFVPVTTYSAHLLAHPGLAHAVDEHLAIECQAIEGALSEMTEHTPFKRGDPRAQPRSAGCTAKAPTST